MQRTFGLLGVTVVVPVADTAGVAGVVAGDGVVVGVVVGVVIGVPTVGEAAGVVPGVTGVAGVAGVVSMLGVAGVAGVAVAVAATIAASASILRLYSASARSVQRKDRSGVITWKGEYSLKTRRNVNEDYEYFTSS
jgi:hypothetical protein